MRVAAFCKGKLTIKEIEEYPNEFFHEMYYRAYLQNVDERLRTEAEAENMKDTLEDMDGGSGLPRGISSTPRIPLPGTNSPQQQEAGPVKKKKPMPIRTHM